MRMRRPGLAYCASPHSMFGLLHKSQAHRVFHAHTHAVRRQEYEESPSHIQSGVGIGRPAARAI